MNKVRKIIEIKGEQIEVIDEYRIIPLGNQKSFYGKAVTLLLANDMWVLESYGTLILTQDGNKFMRLWDGWSATTGNHIYSFCRMHKKDFEKLPYDDTKLISEIINIHIKPGYYSGCSVTVDIDKWKYFDDWKEKELTLSEVKYVQELLNKLVDECMAVVYPGWCTTWLNYEESKKAIKKAMAELRRQIKSIPCYSRYRKAV